MVKILAGFAVIVLFYLLQWEWQWYLIPVIFGSLYLFWLSVTEQAGWKKGCKENKEERQLLERFQLSWQKNRTIEGTLEELSAQMPELRESTLYKRFAGERVLEECQETNLHRRVFRVLMEFYGEYGREEKLVEKVSFVKGSLEEVYLLGQKRAQNLAGSLALVTGSLLAIKPIEEWAVSNVPELKQFYGSNCGRLTELFCVGCIFCCFRMVLWLRYEQELPGRKEQRKTWNEGIERLLTYVILRFRRKFSWLYELLGYVHLQKDCKEFLQMQLGRAGLGLLTAVSLCGGGLVNTAETRILLMTVLPLLFFLSPYLQILSAWYRLENLQAQELLYMELFLSAAAEEQGITAEGMNDWLVTFTDYYQECLVGVSGRLEFISEEEAISLSSKADREEFQHILKGLIQGRDLGWEQVFSEIDGEREFFYARQKLWREKRVENEGSIGRILAMLPVFLVLLLQLVLPFILEGLRQLTYYAQGMQNIS